MPVVGHVDREIRRLFRNDDAGPRLDESAEMARKGEDRRAVAEGEDQRQLRPVDENAGRQLVAALLQKGSLAVVQCREDREDRADRHVDIDIGRAIERVDCQRQPATGMERHDLRLFLGGIEGHVGLAGGLGEQAVGVNVERMLRIAAGIVARAIQAFDASEPLLDRLVQRQGRRRQMANKLRHRLRQDTAPAGMRTQIGVQGRSAHVSLPSSKLGGASAKRGDNGILFILHIQ